MCRLIFRRGDANISHHGGDHCLRRDKAEGFAILEGGSCPNPRWRPLRPQPERLADATKDEPGDFRSDYFGPGLLEFVGAANSQATSARCPTSL